jgi:NAD(P)-dependent dehydrogenase (short-subunit alcohol dehydrogenase family)
MNEQFLKSFFGLEGKVALVTGAGRGLGRAMALALGQAGADLALVSRTKEELTEVSEKIRSLDPKRKVLAVPADLALSDEIPGLVDTVLGEFSRIDILINNAGRNVRGPAENVAIEDWDGVVDLNLKSAFVMAQAVGRAMIRQGYGKIINTASLTSFIGLPNMIAYCASRGGVAQMTKALAVEWAKYGVRVNAIAPGYFMTKMTEPLFQDAERKKWILSKIPMGRTGDPEKDLSGVVVFLASPASDYMTGQIVISDGGWMAG